MQFAPAPHFEGVGAVCFAYFEGDVRPRLAPKPLAQLPGRDVRAVPACEGAVIDAEDHRERRLVHRQGGQRIGMVGIGNRITDFGFHACERDNVARGGGRDRFASQFGEGV